MRLLRSISYPLGSYSWSAEMVGTSGWAGYLYEVVESHLRILSRYFWVKETL